VFFAGGTCFYTPLRKAIDILRKEHEETGKVNSDVVFLTDGYASLSDDFLEEYLETMREIEGATWGINLGWDVKSEPVNTFCEGKVFSLDDLTNKGKEILPIFSGLH
jgi:hypothetical protein